MIICFMVFSLLLCGLSIWEHFMRVEQPWLNVDFVEGENERYIRLLISINNTAQYTYPSRDVWTQIGSEMRPERYPLPMIRGDYRISFTALVRDPGPTEVDHRMSQTVQEIRLFQIPTSSRTYNLYPIINGIIGTTPILKIHYCIK